MIVIIDYGMGNLRSVQKAFERQRTEAKISSDIREIKNADKLILPGVGNFKRGMQHLREYNLIEILNEKVLVDKIPILGICLGIQLFSKHSQEGDVDGLGWIDAETVKIEFSENYEKRLKIPHMGWNTLNIKKESQLFTNIKSTSAFYFVHSYHLKSHDSADVLATTNYGLEFVSAIQKDNIYGTQFHPEKSHINGLKILNNFNNL